MNDTLDDIAALKAALLKEREAHRLTREDNDAIKLKAALVREREDSKATRELMKAAREKATELEQRLAAIDVVKDPTTEKVNGYLTAAVSAQVAQATSAQLARIAALEGELAEARGATETLKATVTTKSIEDALREAASKHHVKAEAVADILTLGKLVLTTNEAGDIVTAEGLTAHEWLDARKAESPYWWEPARGSGYMHRNSPMAPYSGGMSDVGSNLHGPGVGGNPFDPTSSAFNVTRQSEIYRENVALAVELKMRAGQK